MASSALEALVACAKAIQDADLKLADSLLERIWNLAADESDPDDSDLVKYFAEALVRRAYGFSCPRAYYTLLTPRHCDLFYHLSSGCGAIRTACMGKKRFHLITFFFLPMADWIYLFKLLPDASGDSRSVRVSVIVSPFLEKIVKIQQENSKHDLTTAAMECGIKLEDLRVVCANSLSDVDASKAEFTRTKDEPVIVYYGYKLHQLLADARVMERELLKLRQINAQIVIIQEQYVDHNDSNFIKRLEESFQYYFNYWEYRQLMNCRREIVNIVGCEGRDRLERHQTLAQWRSLFLANGLLPVPLERDAWGILHEDNGCLVFKHNDRPVCFISAWKLTDAVDHFNPISDNRIQGFNPNPPLEETVQPLQVDPQVASLLNRLAAFAEIYDMLEDVCLKYELPLALTWVKQTPNGIMSGPNKKHSLSIETTFCYINYYCFEEASRYDCFMDECAKDNLLEEVAIFGQALQSNEPFLFERNIPKPKKYSFAKAAQDYDLHAALAICLVSRYTIDDVYILEFLLPLSEKELKERKSLALRIFEDLKNMKKKFVTLRVHGSEVGLQEEAIPNIPRAAMPMRSSPSASSTDDFLNSNALRSLNIVEPKDGHVLEIQGLNGQEATTSNFHPAYLPIHASSMAGTEPLKATNLMSYNELLETHEPQQQKEDISSIPQATMRMRSSPPASSRSFYTVEPWDDHVVLEKQRLNEQESGKQTFFEPIANDENEKVKADANGLPISSAKRRKLRSDVWEEFTKKKGGDGKECAKCSHCGREFDGSSRKGTSHLRNHLERCKSKRIKVGDKRGNSFKVEDQQGNSSFDQDRSRMDVARMIIKHQYPLNIVEDEYFSTLLKNLQPRFKLQSQEILSSDIFRVYEEEKGRLIEYFDKLSCRFNLTISLWANDLEKITRYFTVQFIDDNWELKKKVLALKILGHEFDRRNFLGNFKSLLGDWNFDKKVCSLTIHNSFSSLEIAEEIRKAWLCFEASHPLSTFYINCDECINGVLAKDQSGEMNDMLQIVGKSIDGAIKTSSACLLDIYENYKKLSQQERKGYPLMNVISDDNWRTCSLVLAIAAVLDPRFKIYFVEFSYEQIYGCDAARIHLAIIRSSLTDIFNEYARNMFSGTSVFDDTNSLTLLNAEESTMESFNRWKNSKRNVNTVASWKSEFDRYDQEPGPVIPTEMEFDVLGWWCKHASSFPILGRMARDILAIPMSSIILGSTLAEKVMIDNPIFNGLNPQIIEAMICGRDWLESPRESCPIVKLKDSPPLAHHSELDHFSSESDNEALRNEEMGREAKAWSEKDVRKYLTSDLTEEEKRHLSKWECHEISGEVIGPNKIQDKALVPLLRIPQDDIGSRDARNYYVEDVVVNKFFSLLKRRYRMFPRKYLKHYSFKSFTATFLINGLKTASEVLSWVKQEDLIGVSKLFLPMCLREHWLLFYADIDDKKLLWLDPSECSRMSNAYASEKKVIRRWFAEFVLPSMGHNNAKDWPFHVPVGIPTQKNSVDCGLFVMKYADCLTHGNYFPFSQDDMPHFRRRTFLDLFRGRIRLDGQGF